MCVELHSFNHFFTYLTNRNWLDVNVNKHNKKTYRSDSGLFICNLYVYIYLYSIQAVYVLFFCNKTSVCIASVSSTELTAAALNMARILHSSSYESNLTSSYGDNF